MRQKSPAFFVNFCSRKMFVENLTLKNFRNYDAESFSFFDGVNVIVGRNAQGKTNCAEAAFLLATGFSPRVTKDKQVVKYGCNQAEISAEAISSYGKVGVKMTFFAHDKKKMTVNGVEIKRVADLMGNVFAVFFNPDELKLIKESPDDRRRFMDVSISQRSKGYYNSLLRYKKIVAQRNNLLKEEDQDLILDTLPVWDEQLSFYAADIIFERNLFCERLLPLASAAHSYLTDGAEELKIEYTGKYKGDRSNIQKEYFDHISENYTRDIAVGYTLSGPHRDDLKISINGEDVRAFSSQGQQRTAAISLKLAELEIFKEKFGEYPLLILDDALSELDFGRQKKLLKKLDGVQTLITCTGVDERVFNEIEYKRFEIEGGKII